MSAPVFGAKGQIVGCLIVMGPFPEGLVEENGPKTAEMASRISSALGANTAASQNSSPRGGEGGLSDRL